MKNEDEYRMLVEYTLENMIEGQGNSHHVIYIRDDAHARILNINLATKDITFTKFALNMMVTRRKEIIKKLVDENGYRAEYKFTKKKAEALIDNAPKDIIGYKAKFDAKDINIVQNLAIYNGEQKVQYTSKKDAMSYLIQQGCVDCNEGKLTVNQTVIDTYLKTRKNRANSKFKEFFKIPFYLKNIELDEKGVICNIMLETTDDSDEYCTINISNGEGSSNCSLRKYNINDIERYCYDEFKTFIAKLIPQDFKVHLAGASLSSTSKLFTEIARESIS